jgi:hypothetical protein
MGSKASKPDNTPDGPSAVQKGQAVEKGPNITGPIFKCKMRGTNEDRFICISFPNLLLMDEHQVLMATFPIKYLRGYGQMQTVFSFETGRKCQGGAQTYFFEVEGGRDVFLALNEEIAKHNDGVAGDRYDHLPAFKKSLQSSKKLERKESVLSDYSALSRSANSEQPSYDHTMRPKQPGAPDRTGRSVSTHEVQQSTYAVLQRGQSAAPADAGYSQASRGDMSADNAYVVASRGDMSRGAASSPGRQYEGAGGYDSAMGRGGYEAASGGGRGGYEASSGLAGYDSLGGVKGYGAGGGYEAAAGLSTYDSMGAPPADSTYSALAPGHQARGGHGGEEYSALQRSPPPQGSSTYNTLVGSVPAQGSDQYSMLQRRSVPGERSFTPLRMFPVHSSCLTLSYFVVWT